MFFGYIRFLLTVDFMAACFFKANERERERETPTTQTLESCVMSWCTLCHPCHISLVTVKPQGLPKLRREACTKTWLSAGEGHGGPPEACVSHMVSLGIFILGVTPASFLEFSVSGLTYLTSLSTLTPLISFRHHSSLENVPHEVYRDFPCLFTQQVFITPLLYESYNKDMEYAKGKKMNQAKTKAEQKTSLLELTLRTPWIWDT